jgi:U3 small nucleolar RNA-associated protein 20
MSDDEDTHDNEEEIKIDDAKDEIIEDEKNDKEATKAQEQINKRAHKRSLNWLFRRASFDARGAAIRKTKNGILHVRKKK